MINYDVKMTKDKKDFNQWLEDNNIKKVPFNKYLLTMIISNVILLIILIIIVLIIVSEYNLNNKGKILMIISPLFSLIILNTGLFVCFFTRCN